MHLHQGVEVTGIRKDANGRCTGVDTTSGPIDAGVVISAVAGWTTQICDMAGIRTPITNHPLQAFVTEPVKPMLHKILVSANLHVYVSQTDRGEFLIGSEIEPYTTYNFRSTFTFTQHSAANALDLVPQLARLKILRQWTGYCDMTPDYSPIMGETAGRELLPRRRLGHVGLQGDRRLRRDDGRDGRHPQDARADLRLRALAVRRRDARAGEGRGLRLALSSGNRRAPVAPAGLPSSCAMDVQRLEAITARFVTENRLPGAAVGVVRDGQLAWSHGYGFADRDAGRRPDAQTLYRVASISKTFTASSILQLRDAGRLRLDDPLVAAPARRPRRSRTRSAPSRTSRCGAC